MHIDLLICFAVPSSRWVQWRWPPGTPWSWRSPRLTRDRPTNPWSRYSRTTEIGKLTMTYAWCMHLNTRVKPLVSSNLILPYIKYMVSYSSGPKRSSPLCIQRFSRSTGNKYGTLCNMILLLQLISTSRDWADLVGDLVGHHDCHPLLVGGGGLLGVVQHVGFSVRYQTPVFHGSRHKVGDRNHVCLKTSKTLSCCCTKSPIIKNIKSQK